MNAAMWLFFGNTLIINKILVGPLRATPSRRKTGQRKKSTSPRNKKPQHATNDEQAARQGTPGRHDRAPRASISSAWARVTAVAAEPLIIWAISSTRASPESSSMRAVVRPLAALFATLRWRSA